MLLLIWTKRCTFSYFSFNTKRSDCSFWMYQCESWLQSFNYENCFVRIVMWWYLLNFVDGFTPTFRAWRPRSFWRSVDMTGASWPGTVLAVQVISHSQSGGSNTSLLYQLADGQSIWLYFKICHFWKILTIQFFSDLKCFILYCNNM